MLWKKWSFLLITLLPLNGYWKFWTWDHQVLGEKLALSSIHSYSAKYVFVVIIKWGDSAFSTVPWPSPFHLVTQWMYRSCVFWKQYFLQVWNRQRRFIGVANNLFWARDWSVNVPPIAWANITLWILDLRTFGVFDEGFQTEFFGITLTESSMLRFRDACSSDRSAFESFYSCLRWEW